MPQGTQIDLFADRDAYQVLRLIPSQPGHALTVHPPDAAAAFGDGGTDTAPSWSGTLESPWLQWMAQVLRGRSVDAVHFVCPGYFRRDQGALAVARSPVGNADGEWSHMIGAGELMAFLDQVGAWAVAFTPPFDDVWAMGVRLLADRLVWQRPGRSSSIRVCGCRGVADGYRFLFADQDAPPPRTPSLMVYAHPKRLPGHRGPVVGFDAGTTSRSGPPARPRGRGPEQLEWLARKDDRDTQRAKATPEDPRGSARRHCSWIRCWLGWATTTTPNAAARSTRSRSSAAFSRNPGHDAHGDSHRRPG